MHVYVLSSMCMRVCVSLVLCLCVTVQLARVHVLVLTWCMVHGAWRYLHVQAIDLWTERRVGLWSDGWTTWARHIVNNSCASGWPLYQHHHSGQRPEPHVGIMSLGFLLQTPRLLSRTLDTPLPHETLGSGQPKGRQDLFLLSFIK